MLLCVAAALIVLRAQDEPKPVWRDSPKAFKALTYRNIGPASGGRVSRVAGIPIDAGRTLRQRPWYYSTITVHPQNENDVWFPQVPLLHSIDWGPSAA